MGRGQEKGAGALYQILASQGLHLTDPKPLFEQPEPSITPDSIEPVVDKIFYKQFDEYDFLTDSQTLDLGYRQLYGSIEYRSKICDGVKLFNTKTYRPVVLTQRSKAGLTDDFERAMITGLETISYNSMPHAIHNRCSILGDVVISHYNRSTGGIGPISGWNSGCRYLAMAKRLINATNPVNRQMSKFAGFKINSPGIAMLLYARPDLANRIADAAKTKNFLVEQDLEDIARQVKEDPAKLLKDFSDVIALKRDNYSRRLLYNDLTITSYFLAEMHDDPALRQKYVTP